jgi:uncharacterized iron-regulated membrane protein
MLFQIHRLLGVIAAVYILIVSASGVALVFDNELSNLLCPGPKIVVKEQKAPLQIIVANAEKSFPGYSVTGLSFPAEPERPVDVFASKDEGSWIQCIADPYSGNIFGLKQKSAVMEFIRELHYNLLLENGRRMNGIGAVCVVLIAVTGIAVACRGLIKCLTGLIKQASTNTKQKNLSVHSTIGICVLPFLILQSVGGIYFGFPNLFQKVLNRFVPVSAQQQPYKPISEENHNHEFRVENQLPGSQIDQLVATAKVCAKNENAFVDRISFPDKYNPTVQIWLKDSASSSPADPKTKVCLSPTTGKVVSLSPSQKPPLGDVIIQWLLSFHAGTLCGPASKCAWLLLGFMPAVLVITGLLSLARRNKESAI